MLHDLTAEQTLAYRIAWPPKPTPRIKQRVASYHTTEVVAHKASYNKLRHKIGCHGNVPQTTGQDMIPTAHPSSQPKWPLDRFSRIHTRDRRVSLYFIMGRPFPPQNCCFPWGDLDPHLTMVPWAHPSPQPKWHLNRFSRFCRTH